MRRISAVLPGLAHGDQPIPNVARVGPLVTTGNINGQPPQGALPSQADAQCRQMFENLAAMLERVGCGLDDVVHVNVGVADKDTRETLNLTWTACFPDQRARPTRTTRVQSLGRGLLVQCDAIAYCATPPQDR